MNRAMKPKLLKRFYEVLVLLRVLGQVQGDKIVAQILEEGNIYSIGAVEMRRRVMYHLCVMCDYQKGGDTVTAIASENLPSGPRYWVATNGSPAKKIKPFLVEVLEMLESRALSTTQKTDNFAFERQMFESFVSFQRARIKQYWKFLQPWIQSELNRIRLSPQAHADINEYLQWLQGFQRPLTGTQDFHELSQLAYNTRHSQFLRVDFDPITGQPVVMENTSRTNIRHYIGRLCAPRRAAELLTFAAASFPYMFHGFSIQFQNPGTASKRPSIHPGLTLDGISRRMFPADSTEIDTFRQALHSLEDGVKIMSRILDYYRSNNWQPRVHAELVLLEALHDRKCTFYDGDKYIACSKPACFCCYHYICSHSGSFAPPPCHNKLYPNWQPPNLAIAASVARLDQQRDVMIRLTQRVREAVVEKVLNAQRSMKWHPDSSTGITPSAVLGSDPETHPVLTKALSVPSSQCGSLQGDFPNSNAGSSEDEDSEDGGVSLT